PDAPGDSGPPAGARPIRAAPPLSGQPQRGLPEPGQKKMLNLSISPPLVRRVSRDWVQPVEAVRRPGSEPATKRSLTMRVMILVKANKDSEAGVLPSQELLTEMGKFNEELVKAGVMLAGEGLHASSKGKRVRFSGATRTVIDGPFSETKELIAGFWLWQVKSMEEAIAWLKRAPFDGGTEVEIRPVFEAGDFGPALAPHLPEHE